MGTSATTRSVDRGATNPMHRLVNRAGAGLRRDWVADIGVVLGFLVLALWVCRGLWPDPATRALALNPEDQALIEWFLAATPGCCSATSACSPTGSTRPTGST